MQWAQQQVHHFAHIQLFDDINKDLILASLALIHTNRLVNRTGGDGLIVLEVEARQLAGLLHHHRLREDVTAYRV